MRNALEKLVKAVEALSELDANRQTYFEASPIKDPECCRRWEALDAAMKGAHAELSKENSEVARKPSASEEGSSRG